MRLHSRHGHGGVGEHKRRASNDAIGLHFFTKVPDVEQICLNIKLGVFGD